MPLLVKAIDPIKRRTVGHSRYQMHSPLQKIENRPAFGGKEELRLSKFQTAAAAAAALWRV